MRSALLYLLLHRHSFVRKICETDLANKEKQLNWDILLLLLLHPTNQKVFLRMVFNYFYLGPLPLRPQSV